MADSALGSNITVSKVWTINARGDTTHVILNAQVRAKTYEGPPSALEKNLTSLTGVALIPDIQGPPGKLRSVLVQRGRVHGEWMTEEMAAHTGANQMPGQDLKVIEENMTETGAAKEWKQARNASPDAWRKHHKQKIRTSKSKPKPGDDIDVESQEEFSDGEDDEMEVGIYIRSLYSNFFY